MNMTIKQIAFALFLSVITDFAFANETDVRSALSESMPEIKIDSVKSTDIQGIYEIQVGMNIFYSTEDGRYVFQGDLYDTKLKMNLTDAKQAENRQLTLSKINDDKLIVFAPEKSKYSVTVFTDIDCGYCRKFHSEIDQYLAQGITVRYVFFPRAGAGSESYKKAIGVWCSDNRNKALTAAKKGDPVELKTCDNPVDEHLALAKSFGLQGTPTIITEKGRMIPGYVPSQKLVGLLVVDRN